jgi:hypothetical protein
MSPTGENLDNLMAWRALALQQLPYQASMLLSLRVLDAPGLGTFAVDPFHRLYIDLEAVTPKGPRWCAEALLHECGHLFGDHAGRAADLGVQSEPRFDWNIACFPAGTLLPGNVAIETVATMVRPFDGELVVVDSQAGVVEATPEHPLFARRSSRSPSCFGRMTKSHLSWQLDVAVAGLPEEVLLEPELHDVLWLRGPGAHSLTMGGEDDVVSADCRAWRRPLMPNERFQVLGAEECMSLLEHRHLGRMAFFSDGLPSILPINYVLVDGLVVFRTDEGSSRLRCAANQLPLKSTALR